ncbi:hypothetical protein GOP47_0021475 [Adiantum capillus-veneris]|uniref:Thioredoxin domain-containing protein n=1 Tax=Adiantum capillus-veneris TaxID=13818 RepID=A0A9D4U8G3_ADICA|nr:hypothetical protein GOP47_0021475 [Adiantum capillus-veneris]
MLSCRALLAPPLSCSLLPPLSCTTRFCGRLLPCFVSYTGVSQCRPGRPLQVRASRVESRSVPLASRAPDFELPEPLTGKTWKLDDFEGHRALLIMFICNHCPFVVHLKMELVKLANTYLPKGVGIIAISANSVKTHPQDGPDIMAREAEELGYPFPYLYDETQETARAYGAACTPDFFLYKKDGRRPFELVYHGQFDESRPGNNRPITGSDLRNALDCVLSGIPVSTVQRPSIGCSIKWHPQ